MLRTGKRDETPILDSKYHHSHGVVFSLLVGPRSVPVAAVFIVAWIIAPVLANIVFILITWRWRHEGKAVRGIAGVFD